MKTLRLLLVFPFLACCSTKEPETIIENPLEPPTPRPVIVGRVASIPADRRFILIQSYGKWNVPTGRILTTRGPGDRTANLLVTGESLGQYAAADLQSGTVEVGDAVFNRPELPVPPTSISEAEDTSVSQPPESESIQETEVNN